MAEKPLQIIHLGISGFPHNVTLAPIQKSYLIYKGLVEAGAEVLYINTIPQASPGGEYDGNTQGSVDGIKYVYTCGTPYRSKSFLKRNLTKLKGGLREAFLLLSLSRRQKIDAAVLYTAHFSTLLYYRAWSKILGFPMVMNYVEYRSVFETKSRRNKISWYLTDRFAPRLVDGILPISEFLINHVKERSSTPYFKVPTLCDFTRYTSLERSADSPRYLLYCGSAAYYEVANFTIASFERLTSDSDIFLYLIINGWPQQIDKVHQRIAQSPKSSLIQTFSNVSNEDYARLLFQAEGLLIPLRPNVQDTARFPNKVGEYVASGNPMVTTSVGEIAYYFQDGVSAFVAERYEEEAYAQKLQELVDDPHRAQSVGKQGQQIGHQKFDYRANGENMLEFLRQIARPKKLQNH